MEDRQARTMEALERRFAQAKAELEMQQQKSKKGSTEDRKRAPSNVTPSPTFPKFKKITSDFSSRKGLDVELNEPAYLKLSHTVDENLFKAGVEVSDSRSKVNQVLHDLLQHGDSAQKYMQGSKSLKIENTILLDSHVQKGGMISDGHSRALQKGSKRSKKHMSLKQHKKVGLFDLPTQFHNFELFKPMHEMWKSYTSRLLKNVGKDQLAQCFLNADLHGAIILVVHCKIVSHIGIHGIVVRETKEAFGIISKDNKFRVVPKKPCVFVLQADCWKVTLHGDKLTSRKLVP
ncbi:ribonuclease MRP protein subunit POP4 isoform X2 [Andrographis paniculata]|uniref:ribonuclease MRP protein subunit POP4 isoform X2 n=1 Tax=Andrographis paniculata TaxID=175694 RepID=UPI0021E81454|nr:ribonuclease MRP protein subunit POP4 isoform X2 [Andrographis paniculata]XP_051130316.1 ribonuclease MRP protein subunit POP4 isoform X2 [Andrographis paniculata]XP_051130317.1 ribonuclease MRP protein subunit POP4 isoform X2 [Andrographis paniculata]XP_051130318.1 ribonuclease MRP protein subunit POP4 isoform X2 [Andrographis paniculata]XP_051130319.1 ribonuclease MRP protein subunit POP4 isoform X2 [Andrographis paniculata]XP_051130320.1 ribonuclease MRP protein subunit POP4 isoform X2 [